MSLRGPKHRPMRHDRYYTPGRHLEALLPHLPMLRGRWRIWEPAAGAGHLAEVLRRAFPGQVTATDLYPAKRQLSAVSGPLDFLGSTGPSGQGPLAIVTNPPYGQQSKLAIRFLLRALLLAEQAGGLVALLLPFEFDAARSRFRMVGGHPAFAFKLTIGQRIRWANLPQKANAPMGHHAWFVWDFNAARLARLRAQGQLRVA